ncbi:hypothetical protein [Burkholderia ambifaria]|uniref:hypothetical protein n=1 Tax=Burkholderia ambifaria TaxID=152480 RepID=UPI000D007A1B|nr:hypothetical protein [Burkholderia ambifaria]PRE01462.1 hypothetical protein C6P77_10565 [Burkholderia ambifaria]
MTDTDAKNLGKTMESRLQRDNVDCMITNSNYVGTALKIALACANEQARGKRVGDCCRRVDLATHTYGHPRAGNLNASQCDIK